MEDTHALINVHQCAHKEYYLQIVHNVLPMREILDLGWKKMVTPNNFVEKIMYLLCIKSFYLKMSISLSPCTWIFLWSNLLPESGG